MTNEHLTRKQVASIVGVDPLTVRRWEREGKIKPTVYRSNRPRYSQQSSYQDFENRFRLPVFIAIGIGGEPSNPERLFVTPLRTIEMYSDVLLSEIISNPNLYHKLE